MTLRPRSIEEHIRCLARLTGAPDGFVGQVRELFSKKGISLDEDATPYLRALDEAFLREESIRCRSQVARSKLCEMKENFRRIEETYHRQMDRLKDAQQRLRAQSQQLTLLHRSGPNAKPVEILVPGDHRSLITNQQSEILPMVPGPEDPQ